ncbi:glycosyltransferase [Neptuniibacter sp. QD72_48]|uniref:glycosyltransferase n=1 Tax=Neptuniibacter sp. QD72_48 TaxID=3398214 RepID=UPI0039F54176
MRLSIITIAYQDVDELKATIESVHNQTTQPFEHILVTKKIGKDFLQQLENVKLITDKDQSLYNAMNLGLRKAEGTHVFFLNSGDVFYNEKSIEHIYSDVDDYQCEVYRTCQVYEDLKFIRPGLARLKDSAINPAHQGFITPINKKPDMRIYFNEKSAISSDIEWMKENIGVYGIQVNQNVLSYFHLGGISNSPSLKTLKIRLLERNKFTKEFVKFLIRKVVGNRFYYTILSRVSGYERVE